MSSTSPYVVIMAGGIGSRFWPYSRNSHPKQFMDILGTGKSLLRMTFERFTQTTSPDRIYVVTNSEYSALVQEHLPELSTAQILSEPVRRNTAPCIAYASYKIAQQDPNAVMIVTPSDHYVGREERFFDSINTAVSAAESDQKLITMGIQPTRPETGYGYIQYLPDQDHGVHKVKTFTEKPQIDLAQKFLESGDFVWNSGIFIWSVSAINQAFGTFLPEIAEAFEDGKEAFYSDGENEMVQKVYALCKNISIDYGVMEKANNVFVVLADFDWSDLGSWRSMYEQRPEKDEANNVVDANALLYDTSNSLIMSQNPKRLIVANGLKDFLVADCDDVLVICPLSAEAKFRDFVSDVKSTKSKEYL